MHSIDADMDRAGFLRAMNRWLRGRVELADARPQDALRCFDEVLNLQSHGSLFLETTTGRAQALAMLERHVAAHKDVCEAVSKLGRDVATLSVGVPRTRRAMLAISGERHENRDATNAVAYLALALDLTPDTDGQGRLALLERLRRRNPGGGQHLC